MKKYLSIILAIIFIIAIPLSKAEEEIEYPNVYTMCRDLRGRIRPGKKYEALVTFDIWTPLKPTGRLSEDRTWVEVKTFENDQVWVNINFITETRDVLNAYTLWDEGVKIRSKPGGGKVTGTAKKGQILEITQVVMGYGKCSKGWVEMDYFIVEE